jgi:hypothetical protein
MSKIPQGEWNAIAARYQGGESISNIARSYDCTPPAIHYILKRIRQQPGEPPAQPLAVRPAQMADGGLVRAIPPVPAPVIVPFGEKSLNGPGASSLAGAQEQHFTPAPGSRREKFINSAGLAAVARANAPEPTANGQIAARPALGSATASSARPLSGLGETGRMSSHSAAPSAGYPGLDDELHRRAEAAIALFRSSFDAALSEGSPCVRERLRQAAAELMRVAARTTIVLDRLNASAERSTRAHNYPRSAHTGEDLGKFG